MPKDRNININLETNWVGGPLGMMGIFFGGCFNQQIIEMTSYIVFSWILWQKVCKRNHSPVGKLMSFNISHTLLNQDWNSSFRSRNTWFWEEFSLLLHWLHKWTLLGFFMSCECVSIKCTPRLCYPFGGGRVEKFLGAQRWGSPFCLLSWGNWAFREKEVLIFDFLTNSFTKKTLTSHAWELKIFLSLFTFIRKYCLQTVMEPLVKVEDLAPLGAYSGDHNCGLNVEERTFHRCWILDKISNEDLCVAFLRANN